MSLPASTLEIRDNISLSEALFWFGQEREGEPLPGAKGQRILDSKFEIQLAALKEKLLLMASHAESAVNRSVKALVRRDDDLARQTKEQDNVIDSLEKEIDEECLRLLAFKPAPLELRMITMAMKITHDLERVGDEATTISRRTIELGHEPPLRQAGGIPAIASIALEMLKDALDAFVGRDSVKARQVIPRDDTVDMMNKTLQKELAACMTENPAAITRCLNLMVISKSLERVADHATNVAEMVVYLCEGRDIRHSHPQNGEQGR
ncbi:MAG TPA: phosphate signaling complex protein PhoU [Candidatus Saccharimonadales bacterium]|nr:phosphate signaling complex protein PhoU [Candidatus Saccharimonadales bacterium]